ncbi:GNAT family N-acetyltransferase [Dokdonia sp. Hel_I_53]|uniref:GNAT family N-acetyltransferase n=1 Tax=Dokdonia sp. Hel_I_53 TaxID=1566287 RepID=UPI0011999E42|nr:GNAT family N-acetyltransferase [Dokdonia sp. Hel_I_53]TVZ52337.1 acetyltransferase (GNAT) family protein [Dokdonia sp. Hel_I_53]
MIQISELIFLDAIKSKDQEELWELMWEIYPPVYMHYWKDDCSWYLTNIYNQENLDLELNQEGGSYNFIRFRESNTEAFQTIGILKTISDCTYEPLAEPNALKVHRIYLKQEMQGKGIGKQLMNYCEYLARSKKSNLIWLDAMEKQTQAQAFYKGLGYYKSGSQLLDFNLLHDDYRRICYMHKMLS